MGCINGLAFPCCCCPITPEEFGIIGDANMFVWPNPVEAAGGTVEAKDLEPAAPAKLLKVPVLETKELLGALGKAFVCPWFAAKNWLLLLLGPERVLKGSAG